VLFVRNCRGLNSRTTTSPTRARRGKCRRCVSRRRRRQADHRRALLRILSLGAVGAARVIPPGRNADGTRHDPWTEPPALSSSTATPTGPTRSRTTACRDGGDGPLSGAPARGVSASRCPIRVPGRRTSTNVLVDANHRYGGAGVIARSSTLNTTRGLFSSALVLEHLGARDYEQLPRSRWRTRQRTRRQRVAGDPVHRDHAEPVARRPRSPKRCATTTCSERSSSRAPTLPAAQSPRTATSAARGPRTTSTCCRRSA